MKATLVMNFFFLSLIYIAFPVPDLKQQYIYANLDPDPTSWKNTDPDPGNKTESDPEPENYDI